jgi:hypothetical protein
LRSLSILVIRAQDPGLGVRLLLARCRIPVRDHLPDLLALEGALLVRRELDAEALVKQALVFWPRGPR